MSHVLYADPSADGIFPATGPTWVEGAARDGAEPEWGPVRCHRPRGTMWPP